MNKNINEVNSLHVILLISITEFQNYSIHITSQKDERHNSEIRNKRKLKREEAEKKNLLHSWASD